MAFLFVICYFQGFSGSFKDMGYEDFPYPPINGTINEMGGGGKGRYVHRGYTWAVGLIMFLLID